MIFPKEWKERGNLAPNSPFCQPQLGDQHIVSSACATTPPNRHTHVREVVRGKEGTNFKRFLEA